MDENTLYDAVATGDRVEVSPDSWNVSKQMAQIVQENGGTGLIIDYGQDYAQGDTLRVMQ